jgi:hypothetical protein
MIGGTVSEPFVDTRVGSPPVVPMHTELPLIGSPAAAKLFAGEGGHGYAALESCVAMARRHLRAIDMGRCQPGDRTRLRKHWEGIVRNAAPWAHRLPSLILEGTGSVRGFLLPGEVVYRGTTRAPAFVRKSAACVDFARELRQKLTPAHATLADVCRVETQPYEVRERAAPAGETSEQYESAFYNFVGHAISPNTEGVSPLHVHAVPCDMHKGMRGVSIGQYLHDSMRPDGTVALVSPYAHGLSTADWARTVLPYRDRVLRQLPTSSFLRNDMPAPQQIAQPVAPSSLATLAGSSLQRESIMTRLDAMAAPAQTKGAPFAAGLGLGAAEQNNFAVVENADARDDVAIMRMTVPAWKFATMSAAQIAHFTGALDTLQRDGRIAAYVMTRERATAYCKDVVRVLLALPVAAELDAAKFPPRAAPL